MLSVPCDTAGQLRHYAPRRSVTGERGVEGADPGGDRHGGRPGMAATRADGVGLREDGRVPGSALHTARWLW